MKKVCAVMAVALMAVSAQGFLIDFNSPGYSTGDLNGQGATATKWEGGTATIQVVADPQDSANQIAQTQYSYSPNNEWCLFRTSSTDLGFTLNKIDGTADFSFKLRRDVAGGGTRNMILYPGYQEATDGKFGYFSIYGNGTFQYSYGGGGSTYFDDVPTTSWTQVSGHVDYSTSMVTYTQDGVDKGAYAFRSPKADTGEQWVIYIPASQYGIQVAVDDLNFVPEPATMGLLALGGLSLFRRRSA